MQASYKPVKFTKRQGKTRSYDQRMSETRQHDKHQRRGELRGSSKWDQYDVA